MTQRSRFFDSSAGDRTYTSQAWAEVFGALISDGVVKGSGAGSDELKVIEHNPANMSVDVGLGSAFIKGRYFEVYGAAEVLAVGAAHATLGRIDRIVVRQDMASRTTILAVLAGVAAASPVAPALTQNVAGVWEISLAQVSVPAASTSVVNARITDERGTYAQGSDILALLDAVVGHRHEGTNSTGRKVRYADLDTVPASFTPASHSHGSHSGIGTDDHHAKVHDHDAAGEGNVPWTNLSSKPATFAPTPHALDSASHTGAISAAQHGALAGAGHPWGDISSKPTTFAPTAHATAHATGGTDPMTAQSIGGLDRASAGGGAAGLKIWVGTTTPTVGVTEGDIWIKK